MSDNQNITLKSKIIKQEQKRRILFLVLGIFGVLIGLSGTYPIMIVGAVCILIYFLPAMKGDLPKEFIADLTKNGTTTEEAEADLSGGLSVSNLTVGGKYVLAFTPKARLIALKDLIWCYGINTTTQYRVYGLIPAGKSKAFSVKLVCRDQSEIVAAVSEEESRQVLKQIKNNMPGVIVGYSQEVEKAIKSDFAAAVRHVDKHNQM